MAGAYRPEVNAVNSLSLGVMSQVGALSCGCSTNGVYALVFEHVALGVWPHEWWAWALPSSFTDFCYYWNHLLGHESAVFWASHVVHHQSQSLQPCRRRCGRPAAARPGLIFYLPMAVAGVPPEMFAGVAASASTCSNRGTGSTPKSSGNARLVRPLGSRRLRTTGCTTPRGTDQLPRPGQLWRAFSWRGITSSARSSDESATLRCTARARAQLVDPLVGQPRGVRGPRRASRCSASTWKRP